MVDKEPDCTRRWYNSALANGIEALSIGTAICIASFGIGAGLFLSLKGCGDYKLKDAELERAKSGYELFSQDINKNGLPDSFYVIDGRRVFLAVDGINLESQVFNRTFP